MSVQRPEMSSQKPVHTIVLDTGAIIRNHPTVSSLIAQAEELVTVPAIISEIRDAATRSRVETTLQPFLTLRTPNPQSMKVITDFARRTGDLAVLSKPDIQIIALAYELECERNGGDWRLRRVPGQKGLNGAPPVREEQSPPSENAQIAAKEDTAEIPQDSRNGVSEDTQIPEPSPENVDGTSSAPVETGREPSVEQIQNELAGTKLQDEPTIDESAIPVAYSVEQTSAYVPASQDASELAPPADSAQGSTEEIPPAISAEEGREDAGASDSDSEGWITPSNLKKHQAKDANGTVSQSKEPKTMQVGVLTTDFAMQNVILQMNLNLLSPSMQRVKHLKTFVLRCHACFQTTKQMDKQFCPRCGKPTLTRVACSTSANGEFKLHLKQNMQWNHRGDRYSIPKPVAGSAHGRVKGGGKGSWGNDLILAEDQKEYVKAIGQEKRTKERNLMDEDYLPSILTGDRGKTGGRIKVGAGRTVNSRKR